MKRKLNWIDFYLLNVNKGLISSLPEVKVTDSFFGMTKNFHLEGLYSTEMFGLVGREERDQQFAYLDIKLDIISPTLCLGLFSLKQLYEEICSGRRFAVWDDSLKDFIPAKPSDKDAGTGYSFFIKRYNELQPARNTSLRRDDTLDFFEKFRQIGLSRYVLVMPAGLRDMQFKDDGREQEDEINPLYRRLMSLAKAVPERNATSDLTDQVRWKMQQAFNDIWMHVFNLMDGKGGFARRKVTSRKLQNGTRNVLSSFTTGSKVMGREDEIRPTDTRMGVLQGLKSILPVAQYQIRERYLSQIRAGDGHLYGVNSKTLKREMVPVPGKIYDLFTTDDGMETLINRFRDREKRHQTVMIDDKHYVALIYQDENTFKVFYDIDDLPEGKSKDNVSPITLAELLYLSGYDVWDEYFARITRFPVAGRGSNYTATIRLETTTVSSLKRELGDDWSTLSEKAAKSFPDRNCNEFVEAMAPHPSRLVGLGGDYDGDTGSGNSVMSQEALEENRRWVNSRAYWFDASGQFKVQTTNAVISSVLRSMLRAPKPKG